MKTKIVELLMLMLLLYSCGPSAEEKASMEKAKQDSLSAVLSSTAAVVDKKDTVRKFIRTANLKFRVNNVIKTTYTIEDIIHNQGGFVTLTDLHSNTNSTSLTPISADSSLETIYFTVVNTMTVRVPNTRLDTTLKEIARLVSFLDYRIIKADDVALSMLANQLTIKRNTKNQERLRNAIDSRGKKLPETAITEEMVQNKQEAADNSLISNLAYADQVNFSTINLEIYQRQGVKREVLANTENIKAYEPGFWSRFKDSCTQGWTIIKEIFLFIMKIWSPLLLGFLIFLIVRFRKSRSK